MSAYTIDQWTICDVEIAANYFLVGFQEPDGRIQQFEYNDRDQVANYINNRLLVGFNWNGYDGYMLHAFLQGASLEALNMVSNQLVNGQREPYRQPKVEGIDLMPLCGPKTGLKQMGVRLGYSHLEELPYTPGAALSADEITTTRAYNIHDLMITALLYKAMSQPLALRQLLSKQYGVDLRSASDAQIGDKVMVSEYQQATGISKKDLIRMAQRNNQGSVQFRPPSWSKHLDDECITANLTEQWANLETPLERKEKNGETSFALPGQSKSPYRGNITVGDRSYTTGTGGLHSIDGPGSWYADDQRAILHIDVTSYYPATILNQALAPRHMDTEVFLGIFRNLVDQRLAAKREGDTQTTNALKIVINSVYGKLGSWFSPWLDFQQQLQVVLTGQLALLWLIERLEEAGCANVLSANTDGLVVAVSDGDTFKRLTEDWEAQTGYQLEHTALQRFAQRDVNNYILVTQEGEVKSGGAFSQGHSLRKNPDNAIITQAIIQRVTNEVPIADTINTCDDITDFLKVGRTTKGTLEWCGQRLGKLVRFYKSTQGKPVAIVKEDGSSSQLPDSENCRPLPVLDSIPDDLDRNWYIQTAAERYSELARPKHLGQNRLAAEIHAKGLAPIPLWGGNKIPKGASQKTRYTLEKTDFTAHDALGTSTGKDVGIIALDLDHPERLPDELIALIDPTLVCRAVADGEALDFATVLRGAAKGKLLYRFNGQLPNKSKPETLENDGYEVFNEQNVAVLGRRTNDRKTYHLSDHPIAPLPPALERYLRDHAYKPAQWRQRAATEAITESNAADTSRLGRLVAEHQALSAMRHDPDAWQGHGGYVGHCPAGHQEANDRDLLITESNGRLIVKCLHETCAYVDAHKKQLVTDYQALHDEDRCTDAQTTAMRAMQPRPDPVNEVHGALRGPERQQLILAPTGSGKSYAAAHYALEEIAAGHAVVYVAANKSDAAQFEEDILRLAEKDSLTDLAGVRHYRQDWSLDSEGSSTDAVDLTRKRLVITHHTFLGRKGDSSYFYSLRRAMERAVSEAGVELTLIVDEVDAMVESCLRVIDLDSRYKRTNRPGDTEPTYQPLQRCPAFTRSGNCENCELERDTLRWKVDGNNLFQLYNPNIKHHDDPNRGVSPTLRLNDEPVNWGQFQVQSVSRHDTYAQSIDFSAQLPFDATTGGRQTYDPNEAMSSLLHSAWKPRIVQSQIVENNEGEKRFPARPCNVRSLVLADQAPFEGLRRFRARYMTASLTPSQRRFIENTIPELDTQDIEPESQALDKITILIADHHLSKANTLELASLQRSLIVTGFQRDIHKFDVKQPGKRIAIYSESSTRVAIHDLGVDGLADILVTYARSSIARGINLPEYKTVILDGAPFRPTVAVLAHELSEDGYKAALQEDMEARMTQPVGRILRRERGEDNARRLIILHGLSRDADGELIIPENMLKAIRSRVNDPEKDYLVLISQTAKQALDMATSWVKTGNVDWEEDVQQHQLSRKKREQSQEEREQNKREQQERQREERRLEASIRLHNGANWREVSRQFHLNRYFSTHEQREIKTLDWFQLHLQGRKLLTASSD